MSLPFIDLGASRRAFGPHSTRAIRHPRSRQGTVHSFGARSRVSLEKQLAEFCGAARHPRGPPPPPPPGPLFWGGACALNGTDALPGWR